MAHSARWMAIGVLSAMVVARGPSAGAGGNWSVRKLPGCDNLPARMAKHYTPVKVKIAPRSPQYKLPVDLSKLTNSDFAKLVYPHRDKTLAEKANALLRQNGFAVFRAGAHQDVCEFYEGVKRRGLPIFITSDALLHLYHVQFGETLRDIEERKFIDDAALISKAVQGEALKLHEAARGDLKAAARLLVGYATVPVVLLGRTDLGAEAAEALVEIQSWPDRPGWRQRDAFVKKHQDLMEMLRKQWGLPTQRYGMNTAAVRKALGRYLKAHPPDSAEGAEPLPECVAKEVKAELALIADHRGFAKSPLFGYKEDYSQYVPRGHYTRGKRLKQYFKALIWYGRMTFLIRGKTAAVDGLIPLPEARRQTLAACALAGMMEQKLPDGRTLAEAWDRLYAVTAYYVGLADDLTPYDYRQAMRRSIAETVDPAILADPEEMFDLRAVLGKMRKPAIYSGLGDMELPPVDIATEADLAKALAATQGMRLMGQRYVPDSFVMGKLVYPTVGRHTGAGAPFTLVRTRGGPVRGFPRGLDVMAVLGSARARHWLKTLGDDRYDGYDEALGELREQFAAIDEAGWNRNMYWSWLYALRALLAEHGRGYPSFMQTPAWADKQLSAALASWSQLRHDTILYAKQSYTARAGGPAPMTKMVEGYVEPVPEFYARLKALTAMTRKGLLDFKALDAGSLQRLTALEAVIDRLLRISRQELANQRLTKDDYAFIRSFGERLRSAVAGLKKDGLETTIVADVHTDGNSRQVLEEGTGFLHTMVVVYPMPDGGLVAGAGCVLTHYEFKQPMSDRLTDEAWKLRLRTGKAPKLPPWVEAFTAGVERRRSSVRPGTIRRRR